MPGPESLWHWLAQSALVGSVLSAIGCVGVLACRQPVKRLRLIELTLAACLLAPLIGTLPGWPTWPLPWLAGGAPVGAAVLDEPTIPDESLVPAPVAEAHAPRLADGPAFDQQVASAETGSEAGGDLAADESDAGLPAFDEPFWEEAEFLVADESGDAPAAGIREKLPRLLVAVYFAMLALLSLRGALGIFGLWRLHRSAAAAPACCGERLAEIASPGGRRVRLLLSDRIDAPVTYLWGRPVIVLPRRMCGGEREASAPRWRPHERGDHGVGNPPAGSRRPLARQLDFALAHEWSHIERGDLWTWYLAAAAQWVFCYQPFVWWLRRQMRLCQDFLADASAARHGGDDAADYAEFLVRLARGRLYSPAAPALGVIDRRSHLHRRIAMLLEHRRWIEPRCRRGWTLTAAALALALTAGGSMLRLQADTAPAAPVANDPEQLAPAPPPIEEAIDIREIVDEAIKATGTRSGLPALLARAGEVRAALELAERMPKKSDELSAIAAAQARAGDRAGAIETTASIGDESERNRALVRIAEAVAERGDPTAVAEILPRITSPDGKAQVLFRIAELHAQRGDVQGVVDTAVKVVDATSSAGIAAYNAGRTSWDAAMSAVGSSRTRTDVLVARALVKAGKIDAALETLGRIEDDYLKSSVVLDIARIQAERGDLDAAVRTAETIGSPIYKASVLSSLAEILFDQAKPAGAREVLDKALAVDVPPGGDAGFPNDAYASHVLRTAAVVQMKLGDRDAARKTFRKAVNSIIPQNRRLVIEAQAKAGDIEGALENARLHVRHAGGVAMQSYELIAVVQSKAGDFDGALATAERSEAVATGASATALAQVAAAQRAAGQFDEAAATFRRAVEIVPNRGGRALHMVAYHQAKADDAKTAFEWARAEPDNAVRTAALRGVALGILERREAEGAQPSPAKGALDVRDVLRRAVEASDSPDVAFAGDLLARAGDDIGALRVAALAFGRATSRPPSDWDQQAYGKEMRAIAQATAGDRADATRTASSIESEEGQDRALAQVAEIVAGKGDVKAALEIADRIKGPQNRAWALSLIAQAQLGADDVDGALETVEPIGAEFEHFKSNMLGEIALIQAKEGNIDKAIRTAAMVESEASRASSLARVAGVLADQGKAAEAEDVLEKARAVEIPRRDDLPFGSRGYGHALAERAIAQIKLGERDAGREALRKGLPLIVPQNRQHLIQAQADAGDIEGALENARIHARHAGGVAAQSYERIAVVQAKAGDFEGALATAEGIEPDWIRATALAQVAAVQRAAGKLEDAAATFAKARRLVQEAGPAHVIHRALPMIAYHQAKAGDAKTALEWASREKDDSLRSHVLYGIAQGMLARQEAEAARPVLRRQGPQQQAPQEKPQPPAEPQARHRAVLLDWVKFPTEAGASSSPPELLLVDFDAGEVLARRLLGHTPDLCVSPDGRLLAVVSMFVVQGRTEPRHRLTILRTSDLSEVNEGYLPHTEAQRYHDYLPQPVPVIAFSRDANDAVLIAGPGSEQNQEGRAKFGSQWSVIDWRKKSSDEQLPTFARGDKSPMVQHEGRMPVLSTIRWPEVDLSSRWFGTIITISFETGDIVQRLVVTDNPANPTVDGALDPAEFQERERQPMGAERTNGYSVGTPEGRSAFYLPERGGPSRIKRIDLASGRPKIVAQSEKVYDDLFPLRGAAASETANALFVGKWRGMRGPSAYLPSHVLVFDAKTLELQADLAMKMDIMELAVSHDGRYLYVLGRDIAVVDIASREVVKRFGGARVPSYLLPLP